MKLFYFGTDLGSTGHYFWELTNDGFESYSLYFPADNGSNKISLSEHKLWPFDPECLIKNKFLQRGQVEYFRIKNNKSDYCVVHIEGSCCDNRGGLNLCFG